MGFFFEGFNLTTIVGAIVIIAVLVLLNEVTRKSKMLSIVMYCIVPIILVVLIATDVVKSPSSETWFGVIKTYSALIGVIGFMAIRYTKLGNNKFTWYFPVAILAINIVEAIVKEFEVYNTYTTLTVDAAGVTMLGGTWNLLNAAAGVILLITMTGWMGIQVAQTKSKDMVWPDQLWFWIIAYDLWNMAYCYNCISTRAMYAGLALLVSCTLAEFVFKKGCWLQHRAQTLALFGMFSLAVDYQALDMFGITATYKTNAWMTLSALSLAANLGVLVYEIYVMYKHKKNPLKVEMYSHLKEYDKNLSVNNLS